MLCPILPQIGAGLKSGDVISQIEEKAIAGAEDVQTAVAKTKVNSEITLQVQRSGKIQDIEVQVGILPQPQQATR